MPPGNRKRKATSPPPASGRGLLSNSLRQLGPDFEAGPRTRASRRSNFLCQLPDDIILQILRDPDLELRDLKSLRLTCRHFSYGLTTSMLFHTANLSRFRRDLDGSLGIAADPRLRQAVRVLTWHETWQLKPWLPETDGPNSSTDLYRELRGELNDTLRRIDWLFLDYYFTNQCRPRLIMYYHKEKIESNGANAVLPLIRRAAQAMPNLHTLVSKPMHPTRKLTLSSDELNYPLTAQSLSLAFRDIRIYSNELYTFREPGQTQTQPLGAPNWGFCNVLLPIAANARNFGPHIRNICFADETEEGVALTQLQDRMHHFDCVNGFRDMASLDLCLGYATEDDLRELGKCIRGARNLTALSLCFENGLSSCSWPRSGEPHLQETCNQAAVKHEDCAECKELVSSCGLYILPLLLTGYRSPEGPEVLSTPHRWENLRELRLTESIFPMFALAGFLARQAHSIKKLHFVDCNITVRDILTVAKMEVGEVKHVLELREFRILQSDIGDESLPFEPYKSRGPRDPVFWLDEGKLLSLINSSFKSRVGLYHPGEGVKGQTVARQGVATPAGGPTRDEAYNNLLSSLGSADRQYARELWDGGLGVSAFTHYAIFDTNQCSSQAIADTRMHSGVVGPLYGKEEVERLDRQVEEHTARCPLGFSYLSRPLFNPRELSNKEERHGSSNCLL